MSKRHRRHFTAEQKADILRRHLVDKVPVSDLCDELKLPVAWVGIGEKVVDLKPFDPKEFVAALFD